MWRKPPSPIFRGGLDSNASLSEVIVSVLVSGTLTVAEKNVGHYLQSEDNWFGHDCFLAYAPGNRIEWILKFHSDR